MSVLFKDTFTDAVGTNIPPHLPDVGTGWTQYSGFGGSVDGVVDTGGVAHCNNNADAAGDIITQDTFSGAHAVSATINPANSSTTDREIGFDLCVDDASNNGYNATIYGSSVNIHRFDAGVRTTLGSGGAISFTAGTTFAFKFERAPGGVFNVYQNGTLIATATDTTYVSGKAGCRFRGIGSNSAFWTADDFLVESPGVDVAATSAGSVWTTQPIVVTGQTNIFSLVASSVFTALAATVLSSAIIGASAVASTWTTLPIDVPQAVNIGTASVSTRVQDVGLVSAGVLVLSVGHAASAWSTPIQPVAWSNYTAAVAASLLRPAMAAVWGDAPSTLVTAIGPTTDVGAHPMGWSTAFMAPALDTREPTMLMAVGEDHYAQTENSVRAWNPRTNTWKRYTDNTGPGFDVSTSQYYIAGRDNQFNWYLPWRDELWIVGGEINPGPENHGIFNMRTGKWALWANRHDWGRGVISATDSTRSSASWFRNYNGGLAVCPKLRMVLSYGGSFYTIVDTFIVMQEQADGTFDYQELTISAIGAKSRCRSSMVVVGTDCYLTGGLNAAGTADARMFRIDLTTMTAVQLASAIYAHPFSSMTYDERRHGFLVYGGEKTYTLQFYDIAKDQWYDLTADSTLPGIDMPFGVYLASEDIHAYRSGVRYDRSTGTALGYTVDPRIDTVQLPAKVGADLVVLGQVATSTWTAQTAEISTASTVSASRVASIWAPQAALVSASNTVASTVVVSAWTASAATVQTAGAIVVNATTVTKTWAALPAGVAYSRAVAASLVTTAWTAQPAAATWSRLVAASSTSTLWAPKPAAVGLARLVAASTVATSWTTNTAAITTSSAPVYWPDLVDAILTTSSWSTLPAYVQGTAAKMVLGIELELIARLKEKIPGVTVASGAAMAGASVDVAKLEPILLVQSGEATVSSVSHNATGIIEEQTWMVAVVMELIPDADGLLLKNYTAVDALISSVVKALSGFVSPYIMGALAYTGRDAPSIEPGLIEVSLRFSARVFSQT